MNPNGKGLKMTVFLRIMLVLNMIFIGFCVTAFVGAYFFTAKEDGLAGGAMVLGYGAFGAFLFTMIAIFTMRTLSLKGLRNVVIGSVVVSVITVGVLAIRINSL